MNRWQVSKKVVTVFSNTLFLNVIVCLLFFLSLHNLFFDLGSQTVCYFFTALKINFKKRKPTSCHRLWALKQPVCRHWKWKEHSGLSSGPSRGGLAAPGYSLAWALFLKIKVFSKCEIFTACYLHKEISTSQLDVFWSHSLKLHTIGIAWKVQSNVCII